MDRGASPSVVVAAFAVSVLLAGCGGGSSSTPPGPPHSLNEARAELRQGIDSELAKLGASSGQIACVDRNVGRMTVRQFAERIIEPGIVGPHGPKRTPRSFAGAFGRGCF